MTDNVNIQLRAYRSDDLPVVLDLFHRHVPEAFAPTEEADLLTYLQYQREDYFVVEEQNRVIGAGGINYFPTDRIARLSWDLLHPEAQGRGIGRALVHHRIGHIRKTGAYATIIVRTSQMAYQFYEKVGFKLMKKELDYWADGYDLYVMEQQLV